MLQMKHGIIQYTVHIVYRTVQRSTSVNMQCNAGRWRGGWEERSEKRLFVHVYSNAIDNCTVRRWQINGCNSFVIVFFAFVHVVWGNFPFGSRNFLLDFYLSLYLTICTYTLPFGCFGRFANGIAGSFCLSIILHHSSFRFILCIYAAVLAFTNSMAHADRKQLIYAKWTRHFATLDAIDKLYLWHYSKIT